MRSCGRIHFRVRCYDATGKWERVCRLRWEELFRVDFDSRYCNHFNRYMRRGDK